MTDTLIDVGAARAIGAVKTYGKGDTAIQALADVTVTFPKQQFTAIMGPSGSGQEHVDAVRRRARSADVGRGVHR